MCYLMTRQIPPDGALVDLGSHSLVNFASGVKLDPGFKEPVEFEVDLDLEGRRMPTFFTVPAFLAKRAFYEHLQAGGADNVDAYRALIQNGETGERWEDYVVLNIVGLVSCADMAASEYAELGPGINVIDEIVVDPARVTGLQIWRLAEDPLQILISERLYEHLRAAGYDDVYFEKLRTTT